MVVGELLEVLLLLASWQLLNVGDGGGVWRVTGAHEHL